MLVAKYCLEHGLKPHMVDKRTYFGGVWMYDESLPGGVMASTQTTSSWSFTEISDFPLTPEDGLNTDFPRHDLVLNYLQRYAKHHNLIEHASLGKEVIDVVKACDGRYNIICSDGSVFVSQRLVVATGFLSNPRSKGFEVHLTRMMLKSRAYQQSSS